MKEKDLKKYLKISKEIEDRSIEIIDHLHPRDTYRGTKYVEYELKDNYVLITWREYAGCGSYDYETIKVEFKTFSDDNWINLIEKI